MITKFVENKEMIATSSGLDTLINTIENPSNQLESKKNDFKIKKRSNGQ